jgi:geranylgeranylglycerol-phosphate geranylgeranyltransferase
LFDKTSRRTSKVNLTSKAKAVSDLLKTELPLAAGICVVAGEILALGHLPSLTIAVLGFLTGFFISGAAMISNDYFDLNVDRINHPTRPLPSGRITIPELTLLMVVFSASGILAAAALGYLQLILASIIWAVGVLYNWKLKDTGLPGNAMVSSSVAMTFIFGGVIAGESFSGVVWLFGALAFMFDFGEEIAGGAMDLEGDKQRHAKTFASIRGRIAALRVSACLFSSFIVVTLALCFVDWFGLVYLFLIVPTDLVVGYLTLKLLRSSTIKEGRTRIRQLYLTLVLFVIGLIAMRLLC